MTLLKFINYFFLQFFFVRLAKVIDTDTKKFIKWDWIIGVIPFTGWGKDYRFIKKRGSK